MCSNKDCVYFNAKHKEIQPPVFCASCQLSINKNWICIFCNDIFSDKNKHSSNLEWVGCDNSACTRWTHIKCEQEKGLYQLRELLKNNQYKYNCPKCRNFTSKLIKRKNPKKIQRFPNEQELLKFLLPKKKKLINNYFYLHSDTYKNIEKIMNVNETSLKLNQEDINKDFEKFNSITENNLF